MRKTPGSLSRMSLTRRSLVGGALAGPALVGLARSRKYKTAVIGAGWWGMNIARYAVESGRCAVAALCDVDRRQLEPAAAEIKQLTGEAPKQYKDFRELLERERPEIAIVATPDHWHALAAIAAIKAGAHVYVEKPVGHTILEGRAMVSAARAADRVVQVGTHRRVSPHHLSARALLRSGKLGKVGMVRAFVHYPGGPGKKEPDAEPPEGLDWDFWCGPAPLRPYNKAIHPKGFRQFLDFANGQLGDWGIHWMDQILWWTEEQWPRKVSSTGGRHIRRDNTDAPDTQVATFEFESFTATWEHRLYAGNEAEKSNVGCYFYGTEGTLHVGFEDGWTWYPTWKTGKVVHEDARLNGKDRENIRELWADFLDAIETKRRPVCDIEVGHRSTTMALLGMVALKVGRTIAWDGRKERAIGDEEANKLLRRDYRKPWIYPEG
jgi:predicted dehydrogenase